MKDGLRTIKETIKTPKEKLKELMQLKLNIQAIEQDRNRTRKIWLDAGHKVRSLSLKIEELKKELIRRI